MPDCEACAFFGVACAGEPVKGLDCFEDFDPECSEHGPYSGTSCPVCANIDMEVHMMKEGTESEDSN